MKKYFLLLAFLLPFLGISQTYVKGYYKKNGTYVESHYRSSPNSTKSDNYSTKGNYNPYTGKPGTKPDGYNYSAPSNNSAPTYYNTTPIDRSDTPSPPPRYGTSSLINIGDIENALFNFPINISNSFSQKGFEKTDDRAFKEFSDIGIEMYEFKKSDIILTLTKSSIISTQEASFTFFPKQHSNYEELVALITSGGKAEHYKDFFKNGIFVSFYKIGATFIGFYHYEGEQEHYDIDVCNYDAVYGLYEMK